VVLRFGHKYHYTTVKVHDYRLQGSFNMQKIARNYEKSMPTPALLPSREEGAIQVNDENEIDIGLWGNKDGSISHISDEVYARMPLHYQQQLLATEDVLRTITEHWQSGQFLTIRPISDYEDTLQGGTAQPMIRECGTEVD
jgi:hypothetical protein